MGGGVFSFLVILSSEQLNKRMMKMPVRVIEEDMFNDKESVYCVPVNTQGIAGKGLALYFKQKSPMWYNQYKEACKNDEINKRKYHLYSTATETLVSIPTKISPYDDSCIDLIIEGLKAFEKDYDKTEGFHWITQLRLPALGCGCGNLKWVDIEDKIIEELKDSEVEFIFCIESKHRPDRCAERFMDNHLFFKGDHILGITYRFDLELLSPKGIMKKYPNVMCFIIDWIAHYLDINPEVYKTESQMVSGIKSALIDYFNRHGFVKDGIDFRRLVIEKMIEGKKTHYYSDTNFKKYLDDLNDADVFFAYCGYDFPAILGISMDLSNKHLLDRKLWSGSNYLGKLLSRL